MSERRRVAVDGGVELAVRLDGDPAGSPVLVLHGYMDQSGSWDPVARVLADAGYFVVRPDHRGHGDSTDVGDEGAYSFDHLLYDALAVMDDFRLSSAHLVGHSMGGFIAQMLAVRHQDRLRSLVLVGCSPMPGRPAGRIGPRLRRIVGYRIGTARLMRWLSPVLSRLSPGAGRDRSVAERREGLAAFAASAARQDPAAFVALGEELQHHEDLRGLLPKIAVSTTVIVGEHEIDKIRAGADIQAATIRGAVMEVIRDAGHGVPMEQPTAFASVLLGHLDRSS